MRLLIDTHLAIWSVEDDKRLSQAARLEMQAAEAVFVSTATIWEIAIKFALRRGRRQDMLFSAYEAIEKFEESGFELLTLEPLHVAAVGSLPLLHGDPFDRAIVAHAMVEKLALLTRDKHLAAYGDFVMVV